MSSISSFDDYEDGNTLGSEAQDQRISSKEDRRSTVYDAVAGNVTNDRFIRRADFIPKTRDTTSSSHVSLPPGEALFRSSGAPIINANTAIYDQDQHLTTGQRLPASDLLKAIHAYSSDYISKTTGGQADITYQSLDGSALLALGVLLEESCNAILGQSGHLAFLEETALTERNDQASTAHQDDSNDEFQHPAKKRKV